MAQRRKTTAALLPLVRATLASARLGGLTDGELLTRFVASHDETAFAELVRRLGPTVLGVCRSMLGHADDAEDAFQVAFMVLARKAHTVRPPGRVAAWLHGVTLLAARKARVGRARRLAREGGTGGVVDPATPEAESNPDLVGVVHEELARLPETHRLPIVLCELRGLTVAEAATELGWPTGTVASRLSRGRVALAGRLTRRGLVATATGIPTIASSAPSPHLVAATLAVTVPGGTVSSGAPTLLLNEVMRDMTKSKLRALCLGLVATLTVVLGGLGLSHPVVAAPVPAPPSAESRDPLDRVKMGSLADLLSAEAVEKDLGLSDEQKRKVDDARGEMKKAVADSIKQGLAGLAGALKGLNPGGGAPPAVLPAMPDIEGDREKAEETFGQAVAGVLKPEQTRRLKQITLQVKGPAALLDHRVVRALGLNPDQEDKIEALIPPTPKVQLVCGVGGCKPGEDPKAVEALDAAWTAATKLLTREQKAKWDELIGKRLPSADLYKVRIRPAAGGLLDDLNPADLLPPGLLPPGGGLPPIPPGGKPGG